jgi:hypothetical protein
MEERQNKFLSLCSYCGKIRVSDNLNIWINRKDNPRLYNSFLERHLLSNKFLFDYTPLEISDCSKITHGICPTGYDKEMKQLEDLDN